MEGVIPPRGCIIIYSCGLTREQSSVFTRTFSRSQLLEIVSLLSATRFHVRVYVRVFTSVQLRFRGVSPENSPERTSRHLAREPLGARPESLHEGRVAVLSLPEIESHPRRRGVRKIERIVVASLGRLLTILLLQGTLSRAWVNRTTYIRCNAPSPSDISSFINFMPIMALAIFYFKIFYLLYFISLYFIYLLYNIIILFCKLM